MRDSWYEMIIIIDWKKLTLIRVTVMWKKERWEQGSNGKINR